MILLFYYGPYNHGSAHPPYSTEAHVSMPPLPPPPLSALGWAYPPLPIPHPPSPTPAPNQTQTQPPPPPPPETYLKSSRLTFEAYKVFTRKYSKHTLLVVKNFLTTFTYVQKMCKFWCQKCHMESRTRIMKHYSGSRSNQSKKFGSDPVPNPSPQHYSGVGSSVGVVIRGARLAYLEVLCSDWKVGQTAVWAPFWGEQHEVQPGNK